MDPAELPANIMGRSSGCGSRAFMTPTWARPRAPPPPKAIPILLAILPLKCMIETGKEHGKSVSHRYWINARFRTLHPRTPEVYFLECRGGRIVRSGSREEWRRIEANLPPGRFDTLVRNLKGRTVLPGFNDNHIHTVAYGDMLSRVRLGGMTDSEIVNLLRARYPDPPRNQTILAQGWDYDWVPEPRKELLDEAFPKNPVILLQFSGHGAWVNSRVLKRLGITRDSPDPPGDRKSTRLNSSHYS